MSAETTEKVRYWKSSETVGEEVTTTWTYPDGTKSVAVANGAPGDSRIIDKAEHDRVVMQGEAERAIHASNARNALLKKVGDRQAAIAKLTELGLTEDQARSLSS
jgi:hypothetical protein